MTSIGHGDDIGWDPQPPAGGGGGGGSVTSVTGGTGVTITGTPTVNPTVNLTVPVVAANGGTGLTAAGTTGNILTSNGTNWTSAAPATAGTLTGIIQGTGILVTGGAPRPTVGILTPVTAANGGTGLVSPGANGNVLTSNGAGAWTSAPAVGGGTVTGTGSAGQVAFWSGASAITGDTTLFWDDTNSRLGIGQAATSHALEILTNGTDGVMSIQDTNPVKYTDIKYIGTGYTWYSGIGNGSETTFGVANKWFVFDQVVSAMRLVIDTAGNVGIGTTAPGSSLDVHGTINGTSTITLGGAVFNNSTVTTVAGGVSGNLYWSMPEQGSGYKKAVIVLAAYNDVAGATITFPTAFTHTPSVFIGSGVTITIATLTTTQIVIPAAAGITGVLTVEGF